MAEIKSSLEIALERAAAMGQADSGSLAREEAEGQGAVWARKVLNGDLPAHDLARNIGSLPKASRPHARRAAADQLLDGLSQGWFLAGPALEMLVDSRQAQELVARIGRAVGIMESAQDRAELILQEELAQACRAQGIGGTALVPNPRACDQYEERIKQALEPPKKELNHLKAELMDCFEVPEEPEG